METTSKFSDLYDLKEELGKGAFSVVKRCINKNTRKEFAVKIVNTRNLSEKKIQKFEREARIGRLLNHPLVLLLQGSFVEVDIHYLVFELVTGRELFDDIVAREFYSEVDASSCIQQILESVSYLHHNNIIHRDLKPENFRLASNDKGAAIKLTGFGLAVESDKEYAWHGLAGSPGYLSPEVLYKEPYGKPVDVWACGVILYILLVGYPPFWDEDQQKLFAQIKAGTFEYQSPEWDTVSKDAKRLIDKMITLNPKWRITVDEALKHTWVSDRQQNASTFHRQETIERLKSLNAKRKLKGAMMTTLLVSAGNKLVGGVPKENHEAIMNGDSQTAQATGDSRTGEKSSSIEREQEIIHLTQKLVASITLGDFETYRSLCDDHMTWFEPESRGNLVQGAQFHKFYFDNFNVKSLSSVHTTILSPHVILLSDVSACVSYVCLTQQIDNRTARATTVQREETRLWKRKSRGWVCVHFHRSNHTAV